MTLPRYNYELREFLHLSRLTGLNSCYWKNGKHMENEGALIGTWQPAMEDFSPKNQADNDVFWDMADPLAILPQVEAMRLEDSLERLPRSSSAGNASEAGKPFLFDFSQPLSSVMRVPEYLDVMVKTAMEHLPLSPPIKRMVQYISPI